MKNIDYLILSLVGIAIMLLISISSGVWFLGPLIVLTAILVFIVCLAIDYIRLEVYVINKLTKQIDELEQEDELELELEQD